MKVPYSRILEQQFLKVKAKNMSQGPMPTIADSSSIAETAAKMRDEKTGSILLEQPGGGKMLLLTERDILKAVKSEGIAAYDRPAREIATEPVQTLSGNASLARVLYTMATGGFRTVPIITPGSEEVLKLTSRDVVRRVYEHIAKGRIEEQDESREAESEIEEFLESFVSEVGFGEPITLAPTASLSETLELMRQKEIGSALLSDNGKLSGIFTERDLVHRVVAERRPIDSTVISEVMTKSPSTILAGSTVAYAFSLMADGGFRHIPIVDELETLLGLISVRNFIEILSDSILEELEKHAGNSD